MSRQRFLSMAAAWLAAGLLLCLAHPAGAADKPGPARPALQEITLQLKWRHQFQFAGYYAAIEKGFYKQAGLKVKLLEAQGNLSSAQSVVQGRAQYGIATSDLVLFRSRGYPVVALAAIYQHSPLVLLSLVKQGIETVHDLSSRKIALEDHAAEILAFLELEGLNLSHIGLMPHTFDIKALLEGKVAAMSGYSTDEPFALEQAGVAYRLFSPRSGGIDFYGDTLFTTEKEVKNHPQRVAAFLRATRQGWHYALQHSDEIIELILSKYSTRHNRDHLKYEARVTRRLILPQVVEVGYMNPGRWRHIADTYAEMKMMPADFELKGFIYDPTIQPGMSRLYAIIVSILFALLLVVFLSLRFLRLNRSLREQIAENKAAQEHLAHSEERLRTLIEYAPDGILVLDPKTDRFVQANRNASRLLVHSQKEMLTKRWRDISAPQQPNGGPSRDLGAGLQARALDGQPVTTEWLFMTSDGRKVMCELRLNRVPFEKTYHLRASLVDISERKQAEQALLDKEKLSAVIETAGMICHELHQPMQVVSSLAQIILIEKSGSPGLHNDLRNIDDAINEMATITKRLGRITSYKTKDYVGQTKILDLEKSSP